MAGERVLVVDDEPGIRFGITAFFTAKGFVVDEADACASAEEAFRRCPPDVVISDYLLADGNGLDLLQRLRKLDPHVPAVVLTAHGTIDLAVQAIKQGAEQFLTKPLDMSALQVVVERALKQRSRKVLPSTSPHDSPRIDVFRGTSPAIRTLADEAQRVLRSGSPIFIQGETGSGKGVLAQWIHTNSRRAADGPFVDLNCAGLSQELLESELFGHDRGAFTGAVSAKRGLLDVAHRGTLFLDEIGDMPVAIQPKLLKVLEESRYRRLGSVLDRQIDIRLVTATHHDLASLVAQGRFRQDLYYRIGTLPLFVPPLRERREDIAALAQGFVERVAAGSGRRVALSSEGIALLEAYPWPGNVRELRNAMERAVLMADGPTLGPDQLAFLLRAPGADSRSAPESATMRRGSALVEVEREHIRQALYDAGGKVDLAAQRLGVPRSSLYNKIRKYGLGSKG